MKMPISNKISKGSIQCNSILGYCNLPIIFDTYSGCSHSCEYCFAKRYSILSNIEITDQVASLERWCKGERTKKTCWCDWNIPLHWGSVSDPFQPLERTTHNSLRCLEVLAKYKYPFVVSTKSILPAEEPYKSLFAECNCVLQCSAVCPSTSKIEAGAPTFDQRLIMMRIMSKVVKRTIIRCQPYFPHLHSEIKEQIKKIADAGCYGIIYEAYRNSKKTNGLVKLGGAYTYSKHILKPLFSDLKEECHKYNLKFLSGENRFRNFGDSLDCCGIEGLEGFEGLKYNSNQIFYSKEKPVPTKKMQEKGTADVFVSTVRKSGLILNKLSFAECMDKLIKSKGFLDKIGKYEK